MLFLHLPVLKRGFSFPSLKKKSQKPNHLLKIVQLHIKDCVSAAALSAEVHRSAEMDPVLSRR